MAKLSTNTILNQTHIETPRPRVRIVVEGSVPYLRGYAEQVAQVQYLDNRDISPDTIVDADALLVRSITLCTPDLLEKSSVKYIASATAGMNHIDVDYCDTHGIAYSNAPGCNAMAVVQYVLCSLSLLALRDGIALRGKTLGIVGVGHVGRTLARMAPALGLKVLCCDPPRAEAEGGDGFVSIEQIQREADIISLHVPLVRKGKYPTQGMVDASFLRACERRPILINACRGDVCVGGALGEARRTGAIRRLVVDCWECEPNISTQLLEQADIATPHIAGFSADGKFNGSRMALGAICRYFGLSVPDLMERDLLPAPVEPVLDLCGSPESDEQLYKALLHSYSPLDTDRALREAPEQFELLRRAYVYPREMHAYRVCTHSPVLASSLQLLGFDTNLISSAI